VRRSRHAPVAARNFTLGAGAFRLALAASATANPRSRASPRGGIVQRVEVLDFIPRFRSAAAPIKFLSLVMREAQPAAVVDGTTASLVVVPSPARFALHKLLVSQTRSVIQQTKGGKDLHQAALLLEVLAEDRPDDLTAATASFADSGPAVTRKVLRGLQAAVKRWSDVEPGAGIVRTVLSE